MAVINRFPYKMSYLELQGGFTDNNGDYHEGKPIWSEYMECDIVTNGEAKVISVSDGEQKEYSFVVYLKTSSKDFLLGEKIRLKFSESEVIEKEVLGYRRYQLQCKIWC